MSATAIPTSIPIAPPAAWFTDPKLTAATPMTIEDSGRVYGHVAAWTECHIESANLGSRCITAPRSRTGYARFLLGAVKTAEGDVVATGALVMGGAHADPAVGLSAALEHYSNSTRAVADVRVGEDRHGIWFAGALRPTTTPEQIRELRGSPLSGDWRMSGGNLELVSALAVNSPGLAIPRPRALVASAGGIRAAVGIGVVSVHLSDVASRRQMLIRLDRWRRERAAEASLVASMSSPSAFVQSWAGPIAYESQPTGDGRVIGSAALSATRFPLPLRWAEADTGGHDGAVVVGRVDGAERRPNGAIYGHGVIDLGSNAGREVARQISAGYAGGISVDLDSVDAGPVVLDGGATASLTTSARVRAATIVAVPAFEGARIELVGSPRPGGGAPPSSTAFTDDVALASQTEPDIADTPIVGETTAGDCGCPEPAIDPAVLAHRLRPIRVRSIA